MQKNQQLSARRFLHTRTFSTVTDLIHKTWHQKKKWALESVFNMLKSLGSNAWLLLQLIYKRNGGKMWNLLQMKQLADLLTALTSLFLHEIQIGMKHVVCLGDISGRIYIRIFKWRIRHCRWRWSFFLCIHAIDTYVNFDLSAIVYSTIDTVLL